MKLCTAVHESCGYKDTLSAHRYYAPLAKDFTACITYQPTSYYGMKKRSVHQVTSMTYSSPVCQ